MQNVSQSLMVVQGFIILCHYNMLTQNLVITKKVRKSLTFSSRCVILKLMYYYRKFKGGEEEYYYIVGHIYFFHGAYSKVWEISHEVIGGVYTANPVTLKYLKLRGIPACPKEALCTL